MDPAAPLVDALAALRTAVAGATFPLPVPSAPEAARVTVRIARQLDDYLLPRLARLDAPLLVVVGGSTGAGKSTLVNSIVMAPVSAAGVLRPTTRGPVLVSHPADAAWFAERRLLPGMPRGTAPPDSGEPAIQVISAPGLAPGLALLDVPDIDSVVGDNRDLAQRLLAAADLWLFVTTAARYADAVPWQVLRTARDRDTVLALVLNRVPPGAEDLVAGHLQEMLAAQQLADTALFVVPEVRVDGSGLLPEEVTGSLRDWLARLAGNGPAQALVIRTTLAGAIGAIVGDVDTLALAADEQTRAWVALDHAVADAYRGADTAIEAAVTSGAVLRGEALPAWQAFVGDGSLARTLRASARRPVTSTVIRRPPPGGALRDALAARIAALIEAYATEAAEQAATAWRASPAGAELVTPAINRASPDLPELARTLVRDWQRAVVRLAGAAAGTRGGKREPALRAGGYTAQANGLLAIIAVCASPALVPTGAEVAAAGGTTAGTERSMETVFGGETARRLAQAAQEDLFARVRTLLRAQAARFTEVRDAIALDPALPDTLRSASRAVARLGTVPRAVGS